MSYKQEVDCPNCQHKYFVEMELNNLFADRNSELEQAFRELFGVLIKYVPVGNK